MANLNSFKIISYNCKHLGKDKYEFIRNLINSSSFLMLQEHCMFETVFIDKLNRIKEGMECIVSSEMNENVPLTGRPMGGCAILWSSKLKSTIDKLKFQSKKVCGIHIKMSNISILLINIYMPCDTRV